MAGRVIVVTSGKGGVGKTTTTANISMALAKLGKKVVVVDGDTGLRNLDIILGLENRIVYTLVDVVEGNCELKKALIRDKRVDGLYLLPTAQTRQKDCVSEEQMKNLSDELKKDFEFVLFDCPAGIESGFKNASAGASEALVVTTPDVAPVRDADRIIGMLEAQGKEQIHLIINRLVPKMMRKGDMLGVGDVLDILSVPLIGVVPEDDLVLRSSNNGEPLTLSPNSPAATAFTNIARRLLGEEVPFLDVESMDKGFLASLRHFFGRK
ncbi:septum site-determining protein MinD [Pyramidobacter piscolens]|nr:septum site-determining protein MinD [Pyramidobacter piscolens]BDF77774.1 site-determining protein [Pyramidobacter piscolens]